MQHQPAWSGFLYSAHAPNAHGHMPMQTTKVSQKAARHQLNYMLHRMTLRHQTQL